MAYDQLLADRIGRVFSAKKVKFKEKEMFGGIALMVKDKMCAGIIKNDLMARIDPEIYADALKKKGARPMDFAGRPMKGFVYVAPEAIDSAQELSYWIGLCLDYNPRAKSSKNK
jgi:TfoX/Sxy family transcriptional regulator of competence genes